MTADALHTNEPTPGTCTATAAGKYSSSNAASPPCTPSRGTCPGKTSPSFTASRARGTAAARPARCNWPRSAPQSDSRTPGSPPAWSGTASISAPARAAPRRCTRSPAWTGTTSPPPGSPRSSAATGASKTPPTTSATPPTTRIDPRSDRDRTPRHGHPAQHRHRPHPHRQTAQLLHLFFSSCPASAQ